jgi:ubiquinone biosynthesis protein
LRPRRRPRDDFGARLRRCLEELGPIFVKFGQAVSTRRDLLPGPVADELAKLQDQVPPFPSAEATAIVERAFGRPLAEIYAEFDVMPLAAASIAQVHAARLHGGEAVVVKILRPDAHAKVRRDLDVLYALARLAERYWQHGRRLRPVEVVAEFEKTLHNELDLMREAANASQLRRNFKSSAQLYVPEIYWDYCRSNVLTIERVSGVPISDRRALEARGTNIQRLAHNGVEIFFTQVFEHNFFHADMHPGNIFVDLNDPEFPRYVAVDFGIVGSLSDRDQIYLAENFLAFFKRDYRRVARLHIDSGWVPAATRSTELEAAIRAVCEPIFDKPLKDISFGLVLLRLFETAREFDMEVQPQLVLLQKTLLNIEGLGRDLYPDLDLWKTARPILERWMQRRVSLRSHVNQLVERWPQISQDLLLLPELLHRLVHDTVDAPRAQSAPNEARRPRRREPLPRVVWPGLVLAVSGALWVGIGALPTWPAWIAIGAGAALAAAPFWFPRAS